MCFVLASLLLVCLPSVPVRIIIQVIQCSILYQMPELCLLSNNKIYKNWHCCFYVFIYHYPYMDATLWMCMKYQSVHGWWLQCPKDPHCILDLVFDDLCWSLSIIEAENLVKNFWVLLLRRLILVLPASQSEYTVTYCTTNLLFACPRAEEGVQYGEINTEDANISACAASVYRLVCNSFKVVGPLLYNGVHFRFLNNRILIARCEWLPNSWRTSVTSGNIGFMHPLNCKQSQGLWLMKKSFNKKDQLK